LIKRVGDDPQVGSILITGAGTVFCAGGDVKGMSQSSAFPDAIVEERVADLRGYQRTLIGALVAVRKSTVAAIPGAAAG
jgi:enoyl-CoA hydratase/carnithine racemase